MTTNFNHLKRWTEAEHVSDEELLTRFREWIHACINKQSRYVHISAEDREDIVQDVNMKLLQIPQEKRPFSAYCGRAVILNVSYAVQRLTSRGGTPIYERYNRGHDFETNNFTELYDPESGSSREDTLNTILPSVDGTGKGERSILLQQLFKKAKLKPQYVQVIRLRYLEGLTQEEVGQVIGKTRQRVKQIEKAALTKLQKAATRK